MKKHITYAGLLESFGISLATSRIGDWTIEIDGSLYNNERDYYINGQRILSEDWIEHMSKKPWCNMDDFFAAMIISICIQKKDDILTITDGEPCKN